MWKRVWCQGFHDYDSRQETQDTPKQNSEVDEHICPHITN